MAELDDEAGDVLQFGVLGPLRVVVDSTDEPLMVSAARLRVLLAMLLWHANEPVPVDELAEMVWDSAPPGDAAGAVRALVMRLRRVLGQRAAARISTRAPGYAIELSGEELDASRFETLSRVAGAAVLAGRWPEVAHTAAEALGMWRGTPLADISSQLLWDQWVPHLEQVRTQTLEWRIEADLHEGRHVQLIPELQEMTGRNPLREHFHAQLMLALARAGRQAEALAAYQDVRRVLVSELGIEPGPELRQLQGRILAGDADLITPSPAAGVTQPVPAAATIPRQLPAAVPSLVGRQAEFGTLSGLAEQALEAGGAGGTVVISAIDGMAGVGKTALAVNAAHRLAGKFPDGQLFLDLQGYTQGHEPRTPGDALAWMLRTLGAPPQRIPQDIDERAALYRQRLAGTRTLIVLDNAASEEQIRPLLPGSTGCLVLVTSRRRLKGLDDAHAVALDVLPPADAIAILRAVVSVARVPADDPVLAEISELCGRLPLALRIVTALLRHRTAWTPEHLAGLLSDQQKRTIALSDGDRDLDAVFGLSYKRLSNSQQRMFRRLGLIPGHDIDAYGAAALIDTDVATARHLLEDLVDHNLLIEPIPGRYRLHDLIRLHARTLAAYDHAPDRDAALDRLLDYYQHTADSADARIGPYPQGAPAGPEFASGPALPDRDAARAWLRTESPNLLAALRHAMTHGHRERAVGLTAGLATLLRTDGPWTQAIALHAAAATTADSLADQLGRAHALTRLGDVRALSGDFPGAAQDLAQALRLYQDLDEPLGQANALTRLGEIRGLTADYQGAAQDLAQALRLYRDLDEPLGQANALTRLGEVRRLTGDNTGAARDQQKALKLYRDLGDRAGQAHALSRLGEVRRLTGDNQGAAHALEQALQLFRDLGEQVGQASALAYLGQVLLSAGDLPRAARHLKAAVDLFRRIGTRGGETWALNQYAAVVSATGDHANAETLYQDALHLARETNQLDDEALALEGIGECCLRTADTQAGTEHLEQALKIFQRLAMKPDADRVRIRLSQLSSSPSA